MKEFKHSTKEMEEFTQHLRGMDADAMRGWAALGLVLDSDLWSIFAKAGQELVSISIRQREDEFLLVVKVRADGAQYVGFVGRQNTRLCILTLLRKLDAGTLTLYPDKFA